LTHLTYNTIIHASGLRCRDYFSGDLKLAFSIRNRNRCSNYMQLSQLVYNRRPHRLTY